MSNVSEKEFLGVLEETKDFICDKYGVDRKNLEILIVWQVKCIQNRKAVVVVKNTKNNFIYDYFIECTYNGDTRECYMDFYRKEFKHTIMM